MWGTSYIAAVVVTGDWEIFHSEVLGDSYSSTDVIMVISHMQGLWHVWGGNVTTGFWCGN